MSLWTVYVGCFTNDIWSYYPRPARDASQPSDGIEQLLFDDEHGTIQHLGSHDGDLSSPQYLAVHPTLPVLYAADFADPGRLTSFTMDRDQQLSRQSTIGTKGSMASAVAVHPSGSHAYVAHLGDGVVSSCEVDSEGALGDSEVIHSSPVGIDAGRPTNQLFGYKGAGPRSHQVRATPNGNALLLTDVALDEVVTYGLTQAGEPSPEPIGRIQFPEGSAPRHVEFHPSGEVVYVVGEQDGHLYVLEADESVPTRITNRIPLPPLGYERRTLPSELALHPHCSTLVVGLRGPDCIAVIAVDDTGRVRVDHHESSRGRDPRAVRFDPSGQHVLVGNWQSNNVAVLALEGSRLREVGQPVHVPSPSSIVFIQGVP